MNRLTIIGNLTRDPEQRTTPSGANVCTFTVAVNRRARRDAQNNQPEADFFRVSAWKILRPRCRACRGDFVPQLHRCGNGRAALLTPNK